MATAKKTATKTAAAAKPATPDAAVDTTKTEVAVQSQTATALAVADSSMFEQDADAGLEAADSDSYSVPFIRPLQALSPELSRKTGLEGAEEGMLINTATRELVDGEKGIRIVPVYYRRTFLHFQSRKNGGGFKGEYTTEQARKMKDAGQVIEEGGKLFFPDADGKVSLSSDVLNDARMHYVLVLGDEPGFASPAIISLSSSQIKKSKSLNYTLKSLKMRGGNGNMFTPPTYASVVSMVTVPESNDQGEWFGVEFKREGAITDPFVYNQAKEFHALVKEGAVSAKYDDLASESGSIDDDEDDGRM